MVHRLQGVDVLAAHGVGAVVPHTAVAFVDGYVGTLCVVDGQVEHHPAVASRSVGQQVVVGAALRVGVLVRRPGVAVALAGGGGGQRTAVAHRQLQCHIAVAALAVGDDVPVGAALRVGALVGTPQVTVAHILRHRQRRAAVSQRQDKLEIAVAVVDRDTRILVRARFGIGLVVMRPGVGVAHRSHLVGGVVLGPDGQIERQRTVAQRGGRYHPSVDTALIVVGSRLVPIIMSTSLLHRGRSLLAVIHSQVQGTHTVAAHPVGDGIDIGSAGSVIGLVERPHIVVADRHRGLTGTAVADSQV